MSHNKPKKIHNPKGSILHIKNSKSKSNKHVKQGIKGKDCIYYNKDKKTCNNVLSYRYKQFCHLCDYFKRKTQQKKKKLSPYDENYIQLPNRASIHESDNRIAGMTKNIGTPVHGEYLRSNDKRRHKSRCIYYDKVRKLCKWFMFKCIGSSHCNKYEEKND